MALLFYQGYATAIPAIAAPWIARSFGLDQSAIARVFAFLALAAFGALALTRLVDRVGRRRVLLWSTFAMPLFAIAAALSHNLVAFVAFDIGLNSFAGAAFASSIVILAEELPIAHRARGQSWGGLASAGGAGLVVFLMPVLVNVGWSWRWLLVLVAVAIVLVRPLAQLIPESSRWEEIARGELATRTRFYDVFVPLYRRRSIALLICALLAGIANEGINSYAYFHAVTVVHLTAASASALTLAGGGLGMIGFPLGAWSSERLGRVPTVVIAGIAVAAWALAYFWGPPRGFLYPAVWLAAAFCLLEMTSNAVTVASNAAVTELFPTALRATMLGWFALISAVASLSAEATMAQLALPLGGLSVVAGWLALLAIPGAILFGVAIDETRGLSLEAAANEAAFDARGR